jgi:hypothetical protein
MGTLADCGIKRALISLELSVAQLVINDAAKHPHAFHCIAVLGVVEILWLNPCVSHCILQSIFTLALGNECSEVATEAPPGPKH